MTRNHMRRELSVSFPGRRMEQERKGHSDLTLSRCREGRKPLRQCGGRSHSLQKLPEDAGSIWIPEDKGHLNSWLAHEESPVPSILTKAFCGKEKGEEERDQILLETVSWGKAK